MADPFTIAAIGMGATAAGGGIKAFGDIFTGAAKSSLDNYQSGIAKLNAQIARQDANYAIASGEIEAQATGYKVADEVARTKAGFAAGNISPTTGTAGKVVSSELAIGAQVAGIQRANAAKRAYGFDVAAVQDDAQAAIYSMASKYEREGSYIQAASSIIGAAGSTSGQYLTGRQSGIFS